MATPPFDDNATFVRPEGVGFGVGVAVGNGVGKGVGNGVGATVGVGVAGVGVGVAGVGVGVGAVPTELKQPPLFVTKLVIALFDAAQKDVAPGPMEGFIKELAQAPELSTCSAPKLCPISCAVIK